MKIALATQDGYVAEHFGHCPEYTLVSIDDNQVKDKIIVPNPGHRPGFLPEYLSKLGVSAIIAGGMGPKAQELFSQKNIQTIIGVTGQIDRVVKDYLAGTLQQGESRCNHGQFHHEGCHC